MAAAAVTGMVQLPEYGWSLARRLRSRQPCGSWGDHEKNGGQHGWRGVHIWSDGGGVHAGPGGGRQQRWFLVWGRRFQRREAASGCIGGQFFVRCGGGK